MVAMAFVGLFILNNNSKLYACYVLDSSISFHCLKVTNYMHNCFNHNHFQKLEIIFIIILLGLIVTKSGYNRNGQISRSCKICSLLHRAPGLENGGGSSIVKIPGDVPPLKGILF